MNEQSNTQFQEEFKKGRNAAMTFGGIVYSGVVLAATTLFISFILLAFPDNAYFTRAIMGLAGLLVGGSMLAFPLALHNWAVSGTHRSVAIGLYYGEMAIIALNTVVSFASLLFKFAGMALPAWVAWYEPFSIISIVYTLFAWGTIFLTDPQIKARANEKAAIDEFNLETSKMMKEYLRSDDGKQSIKAAANKKIAQNFMTKDDGPNPWIKPTQSNYVPPAPTDEPTYHPVALTPANTWQWQCVNCGHSNTGKFCAECGQIAPVFSANGKGKSNP